MREESAQQTPKGFAGIAALAPNIEAPSPSEGENLTPNTFTLRAERESVLSESDSEETQVEPLKQESAWGAGLFWILVLIGGGLLVASTISECSRDSEARYDTSPASVRAPQTPRYDPPPPVLPRRDLPVVNKPIAPPVVAPPPQQKPPIRPSEQKPLVAGGVFSIAQIRYCLAEEIRIDAARKVLNPSNQSDLDRFNQMVRDYNARCSEFTYFEGDLERARREIAPFRKEIEAEGRARLTSNRAGQGATGSIPVAPEKVEPPEPVPPLLPAKQEATVSEPVEPSKVEPPPPPNLLGRPTEEKPSEYYDGIGALSLPQIRYCLAEDIRLDAAKAIIDRHIQSDVDRFNKMSEVYNARCSKFTYFEGDLERARREIEPFRKEIEAEGRARFNKNRSVP